LEAGGEEERMRESTKRRRNEKGNEKWIKRLKEQRN